MYVQIKKMITLLFVCFLAYLFTAPSIYLVRLTDELMLQAASAEQALHEGDDPAPHLVHLQTLMDENAVTLRLFLDHDMVDETLASAHTLTPLSDPQALLSGLAAYKTQIAHLRGAELFDFASIF